MPYYQHPPQADTSRAMEDRLTRKLEQLEMRMQVQQAKLEKAETLAKVASTREQEEKNRNEVLTAALINSKSATSQNSKNVEEPMMTEDSESDTEVVDSQPRTQNAVGHDRSRLTKKNRNPQEATNNSQIENIGDTRSSKDVVNKPSEICNTRPVSATSSTSTGHVRMPNGVQLEIPTFEGINWPAFKNQFEMVATAGEWTEEQKGITLHNVIRGKARNVLNDPDSINWSYQKLVQKLEMRHGRTKNHGDVFAELMQMYRKAGQTLASWNDEVVEVVNQGILTSGEQTHLKYMGFVYGLRYTKSMYNKVISSTGSHTINEAFDKAYDYELKHGMPHPNFSAPAKVNMVGAADAEEVRQDLENTAPSDVLKKFSTKQGFSLEDQLTKVVSKQFQQLGNDLSQRLSNIDNRINSLERGHGSNGFSFNNPPSRYRNDDRRQMNRSFNNSRNYDFRQDDYSGSRGSQPYGRNRGGNGYQGNRDFNNSRGNNTQWSNQQQASNNSSNASSNTTEQKPQPQRKPLNTIRGTNSKQE